MSASIQVRGWLTVALLLAATLGGCLVTTTTREHGAPIAVAEIEKIKPGTTTKAEVVKLLGEPTEQCKTADAERFTYHYRRESNATVLFLLHSETHREATLTVDFAPDGVVRQVSRK